MRLPIIPGRAAKTPAVAPEEPQKQPAQTQGLQPTEATTILPDSEAIDTTIDEDVSEPIPKSEDAELHPDEAVAILPDSEAVDESIGSEGEPAGQSTPDGKPEEAAAPSEPQWSIRWQNAFIVERVDHNYNLLQMKSHLESSTT